MKRTIIIALIALSIASCGGQKSASNNNSLDSSKQRSVAPEAVADDSTVESDRMSNTYKGGASDNKNPAGQKDTASGRNAGDSTMKK